MRYGRNVIQERGMYMVDRKFSKVTKGEIILGAVASLMTGVVVGLLLHKKHRKVVLPPRDYPEEDDFEFANVDPEEFMDSMDDPGIEVENPVPQFRPRRIPVKSVYKPKGFAHTPAYLGGRPKKGYVPYRNYNRYTGNRHK